MARDRVEDHAEILAAHYTTALELAQAAKDTDTGELQAKARRFLALAGDRALALEVAKAEASYARALELAPKGTPERDAILVRWGDALSQSGRHADAARALDEALEGFRSREERTEVARALITLTRVLRSMGDRRHENFTHEAVALLEQEPPGPDLVRAYTELSAGKAVLGDYRGAMAWADRALALASGLGLPEPPRAVGYKGISRTSLGDPGGLADQRRALGLALESGLGRDAAILYNNLALNLWPAEGPAAALQGNREGIAFAEARGITQLALGMASQSLVLLHQMGSLDEAMAQAQEVASRLEEGGQVFNLLEVRAVQVLIHLAQGEALQAAPLADWALEASRRMGGAEDSTVCFTPAASARLALGETQKALALLLELERVPNVKETPQYPAYLPEMVRAAVGAGDTGLAERLPQGLEPVYPMHRHALLTARAALAEAKGDHDEAAHLYADAASAWEGFGNVVERAFALTGWGRSLLALGSLVEATEPLGQARELWAHMGARPHLAEGHALLERATALKS